MKKILASLLIMFAVVACSKDNVTMIADSKKGIVAIVSKVETDVGTSNEKKGTGLGTGFIVDDNVIVTNFHVAGDATELKVVFNNNDTMYDAELVRGDKDSDIAVIKLKDWEKFTKENPEFKILHYATKEPQEGDTVYAIGHPWGLFYSVSKGIVSAAKRKSPNDIPSWWIQTDAHVFNGNSGGPLLNEDGEILGINSIMVANEGGSYGFAIPHQLISKVINDLEKYKEVRWASLGISMKGPGVTVAEIMPNSAASKTDLKPNDKIVELIINDIGYPIDDSLDVISKLSTIDYDTELVLMVERGEDTVRILIKPGFKLSSDYKK